MKKPVYIRQPLIFDSELDNGKYNIVLYIRKEFFSATFTLIEDILDNYKNSIIDDTLFDSIEDDINKLCTKYDFIKNYQPKDGIIISKEVIIKTIKEFRIRPEEVDNIYEDIKSHMNDPKSRPIHVMDTIPTKPIHKYRDYIVYQDEGCVIIKISCSVIDNVEFYEYLRVDFNPDISYEETKTFTYVDSFGYKYQGENIDKLALEMGF